MGRPYFSRGFLLLALVLSAGCLSTGNGPEPPVTVFYYPTAAVISPGGDALYVANSDFDLQFNGGAVEVIDVARVRSFLAPTWNPQLWETLAATPGSSLNEARSALCAVAGLALNRKPTIFPGPCAPVDLNAPPDGQGSIVRASAKIGAFATKLSYVCRPEPGKVGSGARCDGPAATGARVFATVRGDPSLTYFDVDDDRAGGAQGFSLDCGQSSNGGRCDGSHQLGTDSAENVLARTMPSEPFDMAVSDGAEAIVVTHQTSGSVSLFATGDGASVVDGRPRLQFVLTGLSRGALALAPLPIPGFARFGGPTSDVATGRYRPGFVVDFRTAAELDVVRYTTDYGSSLGRPFLGLDVAALLPLAVNAGGSDSRGIAIDPTPRAKCEALCTAVADPSPCLQDCAQIPLPVFIASRSPTSLLVGEVRTSVKLGDIAGRDATTYNEVLQFYEAVPLAAGPSRVALGSIRTPGGGTELRVFIVCFDQRTIVVYDPARRRVEAQIRTGRGPQDIVFDPILPLAYVVHFTDSYIGVVDLDASHAISFETMVAGLGVPLVRKESK